MVASSSSIFLVCSFGRETYDFIRLLNRHTSDNVPEKLETSTDENDYEVVGLVFYDCLVELKGHWDGVKYCEDDSDREVGV
jgi:hypothetical protein